MRAERSGPVSPDLRVAQGRAPDIAQRLGRFLRLLRQPRLRRAAIKDLQCLGARELRDIGIERQAIDALVDDMLARKRQDE